VTIALIPALLTGALTSASIYWRKVTPGAGLAGGLLCALIYAGAGYPGLALPAAFFVLGTGATAWGAKQGLGSAPPETRRSGQVLANGGIAALTGLLMVWLPAYKSLLFLLMASALSAAAGDTLSSELGTVYGKKFFNVITWGKDSPGLDGVVSLEGFLAGLAGSSVIALVYACCGNWNGRLFIVVLAGTLGNLADSILGATLERQGKLSNNTVNLLNTLTGAAVALLCCL
jgi:uncharacterized protein (TIGR00297 family)